MADNRIRNCKISSSTHVFAMRVSDPRLSSVESSSSRNGLISAANKRQKIRNTGSRSNTRSNAFERTEQIGTVTNRYFLFSPLSARADDRLAGRNNLWCEFRRLYSGRRARFTDPS